MEIFENAGRWHWRAPSGDSSLLIGDGYDSEKEATQAGEEAEQRDAYTVFEIVGGSEGSDLEAGWYLRVEDADPEIVGGPYGSEPEATQALEDRIA